MSPITGVVRTLAAVTRPDDTIVHVFAAGHNSAQRLEKLADLKMSLRNASAGKGASEAQAKVSALCEAIERFSGEVAGDEIRIRKAWKDWAPGEAIHPNTVMGYSQTQYDERTLWNARESRFNVVPDPLADERPIDWTPVWSLSERRRKHLPTQLLYYGAGATLEDAATLSVGCSNGAASGNTLEEAILQGFFELVERDAVALWWYNRLPKRGVATETFGDPYLPKIARHYREHFKRETWALDLTSDLGIPVFVAVSRLTEGPQERILFGLGAHLDARIALQRAYAEMNQMVVICSAEDGGIDSGETLSWLRTATLANQPYLAPDAGCPPVRFEDFPLQHSGDPGTDIGHCRSIVEGLGLEMLVLDQTRAVAGMPVAKVIVPGLRHFWARFAPGRLYDVPVAMGWLERPLTEAELNPIPIFI